MGFWKTFALFTGAMAALVAPCIGAAHATVWAAREFGDTGMYASVAICVLILCVAGSLLLTRITR